MKNKCRRSLIFVIILLAQTTIVAQSSPEKFYRSRQYFDLREELVKHSKEESSALLFYRGTTANRFNKPEKSNEFLLKYLQNDAPPKIAEEFYY